jgi:hypothetical protein
VSTPALDHAIQLLGLRDPELVAIFHVSPVELGAWKRAEVPATHAVAVTALDDIAKRLAVWLDRAQLSHFVRQPRAEFGGRPLLQVLAEEGPEPIHAELDRMLAAGLLP